jgi:regulator of cell morphogenesis and NO signaling
MSTTTKRIEPTMTVNEVVRLYPASIAVFNEYGIDTCCGGGVALAVAVQRDNVDLAEVLDRLQKVSEQA